jgi:hypothetical protein
LNFVRSKLILLSPSSEIRKIGPRTADYGRSVFLGVEALEGARHFTRGSKQKIQSRINSANKQTIEASSSGIRENVRDEIREPSTMTRERSCLITAEDLTPQNPSAVISRYVWWLIQKAKSTGELESTPICQFLRRWQFVGNHRKKMNRNTSRRSTWLGGSPPSRLLRLSCSFQMTHENKILIGRDKAHCPCLQSTIFLCRSFKSGNENSQ